MPLKTQTNHLTTLTWGYIDSEDVEETDGVGDVDADEGDTEGGNAIVAGGCWVVIRRFG